MRNILICVALSFSMLLQAATLYVDANSGNDSNDGGSASLAMKTIQSAIDHASPGDEIVVAAGIYAPISSCKNLHVVQTNIAM